MYVIKSDNGFTLIEFVIAVFILMVGLLGLLQTVNLAIETNMGNQLRTDAVMVADQELGRQLVKGFQNASTTSANYAVSRKFMNGFKNYSVARTGSVFSNSKKVNVVVSWKYKNMVYSHEATAVISQ